MALFHLVNHAFFKALLFLAAGAVIHGMADQQDLRRLGGLVNFLPFTYTAILIGSLSLMAFPFLTGFYSKDLIIESGAAQFMASGNIAYWLGTISAGITSFYSFRLISLTFFTTPSAPKEDYLHAHEAPMIIVIPLVILSILSIVFGYVAKDLFVGMGSDFLSASLFQHPNHISLIEAEFGLPMFTKLLPMFLSLGGAGLAVYLYHVVPAFTISLTNSTVGKAFYTFLNGKWLFDVVYNKYIIGGSLRIGYLLSKVIDRGVIEMVGPYGLSSSLNSTAKTVGSYDTGIITSYALYIILGLVSMIFLLFSPVLMGWDSDIGLILIYISSLGLLPTSSSRTSSLKSPLIFNQSYQPNGSEVDGVFKVSSKLYANGSSACLFLCPYGYLSDSLVLLVLAFFICEFVRTYPFTRYLWLNIIVDKGLAVAVVVLGFCVINLAYFYSYNLEYSLISNCDISLIVPVVYSKNKHPFIPWHNTDSLAKGILGLEKMYVSLPSDSDLKKFLDKHCKHLLAPLTGHTPISTSMTDISNLMNHPGTVKMGNTYTSNLTFHVNMKCGVYVFFDPNDDNISQCGSTINFRNRMLLITVLLDMRGL